MEIIKTEEDIERFWSLVPTEDSPFWPVIGLDLDGTLNEFQGWPGYVRNYDPLEGVENFLAQLTVRFPTIAIITATRPIERVAAWLEQYNLDRYIDFISNVKLPCALYLDDKGLYFTGDYNEALESIDIFKPHWEK